jgi:hypothetical protein
MAQPTMDENFSNFLTSRGVAVEYAGYDAATKLEWNRMFQQQQAPAPGN